MMVVFSFSIVKFRCVLCPFVAEVDYGMKKHVVLAHKNWKEVSKEKRQVKQSPLTNPTWLQDLLRDFDTVIVANLSKRSRDAVATNENVEVKEYIPVYFTPLFYCHIFKEPREWREIFDHIVNTVISRLETIFGGVSVPST